MPRLLTPLVLLPTLRPTRPADKYLPGCYSLHMIGKLPIDIVDELPEAVKQRYHYMQSEEEARATA